MKFAEAVDPSGFADADAATDLVEVTIFKSRNLGPKELFDVFLDLEATDSLPAQCSLHDWASLRSELLFIFDQLVPFGSLHSSGVRREGELSAWLVRGGEARLESDGATATARAGDWLICHGREIHQEIEPGSHLLSMRILHGGPSGTPLFAGSALHILSADAFPKLERLALTLLKVVGKLRVNDAADDPREAFLWQTRLDYLTYLRYERTLLAWLGELTAAMMEAGRQIQAPSGVDSRLAKAYHVTDSLHPSAAFPGPALERVSGLTIGRLNRLSAQVYGFTAYGYWERRRVERAKLAMEQPLVRIKEIASDLGFVQLSHFSAWFKRHVGLSPRAFRLAGGGGDRIGRQRS